MDVRKSLNEHCKVHNHRLFYFLVKEITRPPSTFLQIPNSMIAELETGGVIPYPYIVAEMSGEKKLFMFELCKIFGAALQYNTSSEYFKYMRLKILQQKEVKTDQFKAFKQYCEKQLLDILQSLQKFDWVSFCDQKLKTDQVWNAVNLFLRQGLFFDDIFPPTMKLQCIDILLELILVTISVN